MVTIKQLDTGRDNNFDLLRFIAATSVILTHAYLLTGHSAEEPLALLSNHIIDLGSFGVFIFFCISGFLITKSMLRQSNLKSFVLARCLRIFPGLAVAVLFCAFVIGPVCTTLPLTDYFTNAQVYSFVWHNATLFGLGYNLPGTFKDLPYPNAVNGSLWTLPAELLLYGIILAGGVFLLVYKKRYKQVWALLPLLVLVILYFIGVGYPMWYLGFVKLWAYLFFLGVGCYFARHKIVLSIPLFLLLLLALCIIVYFNVPHRAYFLAIVLVYGVFVIAYHPRLQVEYFSKLGDVSYGLYIYAFPVQQMLVAKFPHLGPFANFLGSFCIVLPLAWLSWHFIEKPMLKLKNQPQKN